MRIKVGQAYAGAASTREPHLCSRKCHCRPVLATIEQCGSSGRGRVRKFFHECCKGAVVGVGLVDDAGSMAERVLNMQEQRGEANHCGKHTAAHGDINCWEGG